MTARITISLAPSLLEVLDQFADKYATTRSGAVAELLSQAEAREMERRLAEGYAAYAALHKANAEDLLSAQAEVIVRDRG